MKTHNIKLNIAFCDDVLTGRKPFEIRQNDRGYQAGDYIKFTPVDEHCFVIKHEIQNKIYEITYVLNGYGLKEGYVVFGIKEVEEKEESEATPLTKEELEAKVKGVE